MIVLKRDGTPHIATGEILAGGSFLTQAFDASGLEGGYVLQWKVIGDGTMKAEALSSLDGERFLDVNTDICVAQTKITGPEGDGVNLADFSVILCNQIKLKFTETGGINPITVAAQLRAF